MMWITYVSWLAVIVLGLIGGMGPPMASWRSIVVLELTGLLFVVTAMVVGLRGGFSLPLLENLMLLDGSLELGFGNFEYRLIWMGYLFILLGTCHCLRKVLAKKQKLSANGVTN